MANILSYVEVGAELLRLVDDLISRHPWRLKEKKATRYLIEGLILSLNGNTEDAAEKFLKMNYHFKKWDANYLMAMCLAKACGDTNEWSKIQYSKKAISLFSDLLKNFNEYKGDKKDEMKANLFRWLGRMKKVCLVASLNKGICQKTRDQKFLLYGEPIDLGEKQNCSFQDFMEDIFKTLKDGLEIAEKNNFKQIEDEIKYEMACLFAISGNVEMVNSLHEEIGYDTDLGRLLYKRIKEYYNPEMAESLHTEAE